MKSTKAASRYAKGLLELALENGKLERVHEDMVYLSKVSRENKEFKLLLNSPVVKSDKKSAIFDALFGHFDELSTKFMHLITKNRRENMLDEIASSFEAQYKSHKGIVPVTIISASPLSDQTRQTITSKLNASVKGDLEMTEIVDESLIGGFIVRLNDRQIDASVASQFSKLKQRLTK